MDFSTDQTNKPIPLTRLAHAVIQDICWTRRINAEERAIMDSLIGPKIQRMRDTLERNSKQRFYSNGLNKGDNIKFD